MPIVITPLSHGAESGVEIEPLGVVTDVPSNAVAVGGGSHVAAAAAGKVLASAGVNAPPVFTDAPEVAEVVLAGVRLRAEASGTTPNRTIRLYVIDDDDTEWNLASITV